MFGNEREIIKMHNKILGVVDMFMMVIVVMISWVYVYPCVSKPSICTLKIYAVIDVNHTSIKILVCVFFKLCY